MQVSEHPTDLFAGPAAVDPVFLSQGDGFGIVVAVVAASRNLSLGRRTFRESLLVGKFMVGSCQGACPVIPSLDTGLWLQQPFAAPPTPSVEPAPWPPPRDIAGAAIRLEFFFSSFRARTFPHVPCGRTTVSSLDDQIGA